MTFPASPRKLVPRYDFRERAGVITLLTTLAGYLLLGAIAGTMAGIFGVGGGLIIVPALVFAFGIQGVAPEVTMHLAIGTSLATIVITSASSAWGHFQRGSVRRDWFLAMLPGLMLGAILGVFIAGSLSGGVLGTLFGVFVIAASFSSSLWSSSWLSSASLSKTIGNELNTWSDKDDGEASNKGNDFEDLGRCRL